jgi:hypothetical protein
MSRIDRFLLSEEWCLQWPNSFQVALLRVSLIIVRFSYLWMRKTGDRARLEC